MVQTVLLGLLSLYFGFTVGMGFFAWVKARRTGAGIFCMGRFGVLYVADQDAGWSGWCSELTVRDRDGSGDGPEG